MKTYLRGTEGNYEVVMASKDVFSDTVGVVPAGIAIADYSFLKVTSSNDPVTGAPIKVISVDATLKAAGDTAKTKVDSLAAAQASMIKDVYDKLFEVFGSRTAATATAEYETWKEMILTPADYAGGGLKCDHQLNNADDTELFSPGSALDTSGKINSFATRKIEQVKAYGIYRASRKQQYKDAVEAIENP